MRVWVDSKTKAQKKKKKKKEKEKRRGRGGGGGGMSHISEFLLFKIIITSC